MKKTLCIFALTLLWLGMVAMPAEAAFMVGGSQQGRQDNFNNGSFGNFQYSYQSEQDDDDFRGNASFNRALMISSMASFNGGHHQKYFHRQWSWVVNFWRHHHDGCHKPPPQVPLPAALPLFGAGLVGLAFLRRRKAS